MEAQSHISGTTGNAPPATATTTATDTQINTEPRQRSYVAPKVEELADDE
jgi:translocation protein SEC62